MTNTTTIEIPRLEGETSRAYAARVEYVTMGPQRSIDAVAQKHTKSIPRYKEWSRQHGWVESARAYDAQVAHLAIQEAAATYRADLEEHRSRYQRTGKALHGVATRLLERIATNAASMEMTPAALGTVTKALQVAADLEAHALRVGDLLPRLGDDLHD